MTKNHNLEIILEPDYAGFVPVIKSVEINQGEMTAVTINQTPVILTRIDGAIHAFSARCPHASGDLTRGELRRGRINCLEHDYKFDIRTGFPVWPEDEVCRLKKYPVTEIKGVVHIKI